MFSANDIRNITFDTVKKGYSIVDVDSFLSKIAGEYETLQQEYAAMIREKENEVQAVRAEKDEMEEKMLILADKLEEYRADENVIRNALINAEKLKENLVGEAQQTADILLKDARTKADRIVETARSQVASEESKYLRIQAEVVKFKNSIIDLYRDHISLISNLPDEQDIQPVEAILAEPAEQPEPAAEAPAAEEPVVEAPAEDYNLVADITNDLLNAEEIPAAPVFEEEAPAAEESKPETGFSRFDFGDRFSF